MPLNDFFLDIFYDFSDIEHFFIEIRILELEKSLYHFLLLTVLHINVNLEENECN